MVRSAAPSVDDVRITVGGPAARPELEAEWRSLEERADGSFFTSWLWIGCWLDLLPSHLSAELLRAEADGRTVGLGLLVPNRSRRHGVIVSRGLFLHSTGAPDLDELTVEYNGFLCERGWEAVVTQASMRHLLRERPDWDEWVVDGADARFYDAHASAASPAGHGPSMSVVRQATPYVVDLHAFGSTAGGQYLDLLGAKTRKKIRRSFRHLEEHGPVRLDEATTVEEALEYLAALKTLHQVHWRGRGKPGSFAQPFFERFHRTLIERGQPEGRTQLLRLSAGETVIGYLYDFIYRDHVHVYQTGFAYDSFPSVSPGYVAHVLAIEKNAAAGHAIYDFMAGQEDYKQRMGRPTAELRWIVVQRDRLKFRLEALLRSSYRRLRSSARPVADGGAPEEASGRVRP